MLAAQEWSTESCVSSSGKDPLLPFTENFRKSSTPRQQSVGDVIHSKKLPAPPKIKQKVERLRLLPFHFV
jgi:hypothetical protein